MSAPRPRPGILDIDLYVGGKSQVDGAARVIKLSSNEGALGPSPKALEAYRAKAEDLHRYPDGNSAALREAIGARYGLDSARIVCGNGSDELISNLARAYAGPGDEVIYSRHGFLMYPIVGHSVGATPVVAPETELRADVDALLAAVSERTRIVFLANPNNPTGTYVSREELERLRAGLREDILLVLDGAYAEFVTRNDYTPGIELVDAGENVVMTRTFSKIHALAGLRLGWAYCPPAVADVLNRLRIPFNVTLPAQAAGMAAIEDLSHTDACRAHNDRWQPWFTDQVAKLGFEPVPSVANFVLVRFPDEKGRDAAAANAFLNARGIIPRAVEAYGLGDCLRFTVGREDEMRAAVDALAEFAG